MIDIHAIHGFLSLPSDWETFNLTNLYTYDLTEAPIAPSSDGFWGWAKRFNHHCTTNVENHSLLMGYSLGGRLGLHALLENPAKWKAGIIISAHTGFKTEQEKINRIHADQVWAERFLNEPWQKVLHEWNSQSVFAGVDFPIRRQENQFSRKDLADQLRFFSRGNQDDLSQPIQNIPLPILWICGEKDINFSKAAAEINFTHPLSRVDIVEGAAHRVPWEKPEKFQKIIHSFINEVSSCL